MSEYKDLCKWLRDHSSGAYRKSAEAAEVIENLEAKRDALQAELEQLKNPWISVEDGLPIKTKMVLVKCNDIVSEWEQLIEAYVCPEYGNIFWQVEGEDFTPIVTHWMPLKKLEGEGDE